MRGIKVESKVLAQIASVGVLLKVPFFQREYVWDKEEWERLVEDVADMLAQNTPYFFGALMFKNEELGPAGTRYGPDAGFSSAYLIVDGQQRLTSFVLLLKAAASLDLTGRAETEFRRMFIQGPRAEHRDGTPRIVHNHVDREAFERIVLMNPERPVDTEEDTSRIVRAYQFFRTRLSELARDPARPSAIDLRRLRALATFTVITTGDGDEQRIYDATNSLGMRLSGSDLLKNYLFMDASQETEYDRTWGDMFERNGEREEYWYGSSRRPLIDVFFQALLQMLIAERDRGTDDAAPQAAVSAGERERFAKPETLFQSYRTFLERFYYTNLPEPERKRKLLSAVMDYAGTFMETIRPDVLTAPSGCDPLDRLSIIIFGMDYWTIVPYVLSIARNVPSEADRTQMYAILESYLVRRIFTRARTNSYGRIFRSMVYRGINTPDALREQIMDMGTQSALQADDDAIRKMAECVFYDKRLTLVMYLLETALADRQGMVPGGPSEYACDILRAAPLRNAARRTRRSEAGELGNAFLARGSTGQLRGVRVPGSADRSLVPPGAAGLPTLRDFAEERAWDAHTIRERTEAMVRDMIRIWPAVPGS